MKRFLKNYIFSFFCPKQIKLKRRSDVISPSLVNQRILVYTGKIFISIFITKKMIGYKIGEFCFTRRKSAYKAKRKKK